MSDRISAAEARRLREAATPGPWTGDCHDGSVKYSVRGSDGEMVLAVDHKNGTFGFMAYRCDGDERLVLASPTLAATVEALEADNARLRRMLACERGEGSGPPGWMPGMGGDWTHDSGGLVRRATKNGHTVWLWHAHANDGGSREQVAPTAYEAMLAADAARGSK